MRVVVFIFTVVTLTSALEFQSEWDAWKLDYSKHYSDDLEELNRYNIWQANKKLVEEHNRKELGFTLGMNQFADLESHEVANGFKAPTGRRFDSSQMFVPDPYFQADMNVNWTAKGAVTPVGNQLQCGSCWAFSATGALEGQHFIKTGKLVSLSEQNLMDCTYNSKYNNNGCNGGFMKSSFQYIKDNGGIDTEASYPYTAKDNKCRYNTSNIGATCTGYKTIPSKDEQALMQAVQSVGPVSAAVDGEHSSFSMYKSGIYYEPACSETNVNHSPLVVGFGTVDGKDYWLLKNSWGTGWGMNGYMMMARNRNNNCGIATLASYPTV